MPKRVSDGVLAPPDGQGRSVPGAASAVDHIEEVRDMVSIRVLLSYPPGANRLWRHYQDRMLVAPEAAGWKKEVAWRVKAAGVRPMTGPVAVELMLHPRRTAKGLASKTRLDLDAPIKPLLDALQGVAYANDKQVVKITAMVGAPLPGGGLTVQVDAVLSGASSDD